VARETLELYKMEFGGKDPNTLTAINNLSVILRSQGKYKEVESLSRQALKGYEDELGLKHPSTLFAVSNSATLLQM